jgi:hypothetical protein
MAAMKNSALWLTCILVPVTVAGVASAGGPSPSDTPVKVTVAVSPTAVGAGSDTSVTVRLDPKPGIKMNKYPKIKLQIAAVPGLVDSAEESVGNPGPPPANQLDANYFHGGIDPLTLKLHVDPKAVKGPHEIPARLSYFYCVAASGYCAPAKADLTIPVNVR